MEVRIMLNYMYLMKLLVEYNKCVYKLRDEKIKLYY